LFGIGEYLQWNRVWVGSVWLSLFDAIFRSINFDTTSGFIAHCFAVFDLVADGPVMNFETWATWAGILVSLILGVLNFRNSSVRNKSQGMLDEGNYINTLNESVRLANTRALNAERETVDVENKGEEREKRLIKRIDELDEKLEIVVAENKLLKKEMADMHMAQVVSQRLIEEQRREIIALQGFSERLVKQVISFGGIPELYKPHISNDH